MAVYEYDALNESGQPVHGTLVAPDEAAARRALQSQGLTIVDLLWCPIVVDDAGTLGDAELDTLVHAVGMAARSRVPLDVTLSILAEDTNDPRLAAVASRIAQRVQQGATVDEAVGELEQDLPGEIRGLVQAGIESGDLAGAFELFMQQRLASQRIARRIRIAVAYPVVILSILAPLALFLSLFVVPMFADLYHDFDIELPQITQMILQTSDQLPGLIVGLLLAVLAIPIALRLLGGRWLLHRFRAAIPLFGRLWVWSGQREFATLLAAFLDRRRPLAEAVESTGKLMSDRNVARACQRVSERLQSGESLSESLSQSISFDRTLTAMTGWGESYGLLPDALRIAGDMYEDRVEQHLTLVQRLLPSGALILVGTLAFFVVAGLFIPLVRLVEGLSM
jgi:type II secretory pathway component PulF